MKVSIYGLIILIIATSCIRSAEIADIDTDEILVVDGIITDENRRQQVVVSFTIPLSSEDTLRPVSNLVVSILENDDRTLDFEEVSPGVYQSTEEFAGVVGNEYQLLINFDDGRSYQSSRVEMQPTPPIDSIYAVFTPNPIINPDGGDFEFFVDARDNTTSAQYFRWSWQAASTLKVANPSRFEWLGGNEFRVRELGGDNSEDQVEQCWIDQPSTQIIVREQEAPGLGIIAQRVHSFHSDSRAMSIDFGIEVRQYGLSLEAFNYWNLLAESTQSTGFLFDRQVGSIRGNISNPNDPEELVLGYFEAAEEKKLFRRFNHLEFGDDGFRRRSQFFVDCFDVEPRTTDPSQLGEFMEEFFPAWEIAFFITDGPAVFYPQRCSNCLIFGENREPSYWE